MITATLIGGDVPPLVQLIVSGIPSGESWEILGSSDGYSWHVPGGVGVSDGGQEALVDNRAPLNRPIVYTVTSETVTSSSAPLTVPLSADPRLVPHGGGALVLQSLDGQRRVVAGLLVGSFDVMFETAQARFRVPGRRRPVLRYAVTADLAGTLVLLVPVERSTDWDELIAPGEPLLVRLGADMFDLSPVMVIGWETPTSNAVYWAGFRRWTLPFVIVDDPYLDVRLGAFSWDDFDAAVSGMSWDDFDAAMSGTRWNQFDAFDWDSLG